ncbi:MAG: GNAT family N-acetyltransferase [Actinomycetota bacterium]
MDDEALGRGFAEVSRQRRLASGGEVVEVDGLLLLFFPVPGVGVDYVVVAREPFDPVAALAEAEAIFARRGRGFGLDVQAGRHPSVDEAVRTRGLRFLFDRPIMTAPLEAIPAVTVPGKSEVLRATSPGELDALAAIDAEVFGSSLAISRCHYAEALLETPGAAMVAAKQDGRPVGAAIAFAADSSIGVFGVAVLPNARGRGLGAALTSAAAHAVGRDGDQVWLQPTEPARPLYERLGLRDRAVSEIWVGT